VTVARMRRGPGCNRRPGLSPWAGVALLLAFAWCTLSTGPARAATIAPYPGIAYPNGAYNSRCAPISVSPPVVEIGQRITESAGPPTDQCGGTADKVSWVWAVGGHPVSGCKANGSVCVVKELFPTDLGMDGQPTSVYHWSQDCINGNSPFGGWSSCGLYVVLDHAFEVSGSVTAAGSSGQGVSGVRLKASCPHGGTTTTDASGEYNFVLERGDCKVSVVAPPGETAAPAQRTIHVDHNLRGVDFALNCAGGVRAHDVAAAAAAAGCPLKVFVKVVGPIANFGTRSGLAIDNGIPNEGPVNFIVPSYSKIGSPISEPFAAGQRCVSGCANVLVTVIDAKTHKPAVGATVTAELSQIVASAGPAGLHQEGDQFLCTQSDDPAATRCGASLSDLTVDPNGQVRLIYWAPGEVRPAHTEIKASATNCSSTCTLGREVGSNKASVGVRPYLIYHHDGVLEAPEARILKEAVGNPGIGDLLTAADHKVLELVLEELAKQELVQEGLVHAVSGPLGYGVAFLIDLSGAWSELKEQWALQGAFIEAADLSEVGIATGSSDTSQIPARSKYFDDELLHGLGNSLHLGAGGMLWDLGKRLNREYRGKPLSRVADQHFTISVYETSSCNGSDSRCGPGYLDQGGIQPRLCMDVSWSDGLAWSLCSTRSDPYDPIAWTDSQPHIDASLP
jgi:hypothetical protein